MRILWKRQVKVDIIEVKDVTREKLMKYDVEKEISIYEEIYKS